MMDPFDGVFPTVGHNSDDLTSSPVSSLNYSSCDGSDFDRYCSANSILGTASVCSSVVNHSDLLDSLRSLGLGEDSESGGGGGRERILRGGSGRSGDATGSDRFDCLPDGATDSPMGNGSHENNVYLRSLDVLPGIRSGSRSLPSPNEDYGSKTSKIENGSMTKSLSFQLNNDNGSNHDISGGTSSHRPGASEERHVSSKLDFQEVISEHVQHGFFPDEDIDSTRGYSDDEDMLDSGTDDEARIRSCRRVSMQHIKATSTQNVSPLLMGSAVAFGDNDWNDFVLETGGDDSTHSPFISDYGNNPFLQSSNENVFVDSIAFGHSITSTAQGSDQEDNARNMLSPSSDVKLYDLTTNGKRHHVSKPFGSEDNDASAQMPLASGDTIEGTWAHGGNDSPDGCSDVEDSQLLCGQDVAGHNADNAPKKYDESKFSLFPLHDSMPMGFISTEALQFKESGSSEELKSVAVQPLVENGDDSVEMDEKAVVPGEIEKLDTDEFFDDMVLEMEEILLNSRESLRARNVFGVVQDASQHSLDFRDGSSTASTSGANHANSLGQFPAKIEWVEVVGAKQKKGDVSFGERLVGVKEYTVYRLHVWSGKDQWEVERRYRDFFSLYHQLQKLFSGHGLSLPSPWSKVDQESRKIFGNASPHVVNMRSSLIQDCLQSILSSRAPFGIPSSFVWFLTASKDLGNQPNNLFPPSPQTLTDDVKSSSSYCGDSHTEDVKLGKTISLIVELKFRKSVRQLLEEQCYTCAGCHRCLDSGKNLMQEFVQTLGWGKPRLCEYTGQLFCAKCQTGDTAVLPARVLHHWDFSLYPVSQLAKAYLESIYDQPMLCVSAVNPFLFSKVPALRHVMDIRKKIGSMLPYVRCPFRRSIQRGLGSRRYLLESNDFFAIRDLVDLSKGAFSALPLMVEAVSSKILHHISHECLECYDVGVPCAAKEACKDPVSLILPFQEAEAARCGLCGSLFHEPCIAQLGRCPCSKLDSATDARKVCADGHNIEDAELNTSPNLQIQKNSMRPLTGFFSDILSKAMPEKLWKPRNNNPVILMSSLPVNSL